jgi:tRNA threonylcarbamoyladenosine biosynthesis protein TsaB
MPEVEAYVVAGGPGSFTGLRVGLTTVKAWSEVYGRPIAAISRLEAMASQADPGGSYVAAFADAQRGQVFGGVYQRNGAGLEPLGEEMVIAPGQFVEWVANQIKGEQASWVSMDPERISSEEGWVSRKMAGERIKPISGVLAPALGLIGARRLAAGLSTDSLALDANYVRRSDAEIFWKGGRHHVR